MLYRKITPYIYIAPVIIILILLMLYPILKVIYYSFFDNILIVSEHNFIGIDNYKKIITDNIFLISLGNTIYFTVLSVIFHFLLGLLFAIILNTNIINSTIVKSLCRALYILPWLFTAVIVAVLWRLIFDPFGIFNYIISKIINNNIIIGWFSNEKTALNAIIIVNIWAGYPFHMVSILAALQGVPRSLYEAALIDGATDNQRFIYITIPSIKPVIFSIILLDIIWTMQLFPLIWMATGGGPIHATEILSTFTYKKAFSEFEYSQAATSSVVILIISMILSYFYIQNQKSLNE